MEIADSEASGIGSRPVLLTPVGLRPPCVSKTDLQNLERFRLFLSLTSLTNEQYQDCGYSMLYLPQTVREGRVFAPKVHQWVT